MFLPSHSGIFMVLLTIFRVPTEHIIVISLPQHSAVFISELSETFRNKPIVLLLSIVMFTDDFCKKINNNLQKNRQSPSKVYPYLKCMNTYILFFVWFTKKVLRKIPNSKLKKRESIKTDKTEVLDYINQRNERKTTVIFLTLYRHLPTKMMDLTCIYIYIVIETFLFYGSCL